MYLKITGCELAGVLNVFQNHEPFSGCLNKDGSCTLSGKIKTLMSEFKYTAHGCFDHDMIELALSGDKSSFHLKGRKFENAQEEFE